MGFAVSDTQQQLGLLMFRKGRQRFSQIVPGYRRIICAQLRSRLHKTGIDAEKLGKSLECAG